MRVRNAIKVIFSLILTIGYSNVVLAQTAFTDRNYKYIDSVERVVKHFYCNDLLTYPADYKKKKIQSDMRIVDFLNHIFQRDFTAGRLDAELSKIQKLKISRGESINGLIRVISIVANGNYIRTELTLECVNDNFIRKKCLLFTSSKGKCSEIKYSKLDFNLVKRFFIKEMDFLLEVMDNDHFVAAD